MPAPNFMQKLTNLLKSVFIAVVVVIVIAVIYRGALRYLEWHYTTVWKELRMDFLRSSFETLESAFEQYEQSQKDSAVDGEKEQFYFELRTSEARLAIKHILQHFDKVTLPIHESMMPPVLLSVQAFQYEEIDGIIVLVLTYIEEGLSVGKLNVIFRNRNVLLKEREYYSLAKRHKENPYSLSDIMNDVGFQRYWRFLLYTDNQEDKIEDFLSPYMQVPDWQNTYVAKISKDELEQLKQSEVCANFILLDGTHSNFVPVRFAHFKKKIPGYVDLKTGD